MDGVSLLVPYFGVRPKRLEGSPSGRGSHGIPDRRDRVQIVHDVSRGELLAELFSSLSASMLAALVPLDLFYFRVHEVSAGTLLGDDLGT